MIVNLENTDFIVETVAVTHQGRVRKLNEDSICANPKAGVWVVADGMGGHKDGNIASAMIADAVRDLGAKSSMDGKVSQFSTQIHSINRKLLEVSNGDNDLITGSTVVGLLIHENAFACIWAGDSRCYLVRAGQIKQMTHDHTEVQELVDRGILTAEEARTWPRRNVITRAVGTHDELQLDSDFGSLLPGDWFILCSDGLTGHLDDQEILDTISWSNPQEACDKLLALALERGGKDNISIIVVSLTQREATLVVQRW